MRKITSALNGTINIMVVLVDHDFLLRDLIFAIW